MTNRVIDTQLYTELCTSHEVAPHLQQYMTNLSNYKLVALIDDSGSMRYESLMTGETSWASAHQFVRTLISLNSVSTNHSMDLCFLSRAPFHNITSVNIVDEAFHPTPDGSVSLTDALKQILSQPYDASYQGRIIIVCTDADAVNSKKSTTLWHLLDENRRLSDYVTFIVYNTSKKQWNALQTDSEKLFRFATMLDYESELVALTSQGEKPVFSYADYVLNAVIRCVVPKLKDDQPLQVEERSHCCCNLL
jgi:hypothetical protein